MINEGLTGEEAERLGHYWPLVCKEIDLRICSTLNSFKTCSKEDLGRLQERVAVYEELKRMPFDVKERLSF